MMEQLLKEQYLAFNHCFIPHNVRERSCCGKLQGFPAVGLPIQDNWCKPIQY
jgi:hypothetical protein